jgi:hypothetical protein
VPVNLEHDQVAAVDGDLERPFCPNTGHVMVPGRGLGFSSEDV